MLMNEKYRRRDMLLCILSSPEKRDLDVDTNDPVLGEYHPICHLLGFIKLLTNKGKDGIYRYSKKDEVILVMERATKPDTPRFIQAAYILHMIYQEKVVRDWFYHRAVDKRAFTEFISDHLTTTWQEMLNCDLGGSLPTVVNSLIITYETMIPRNVMTIDKLKIHHTIYKELCAMKEKREAQQKKSVSN